MEIQALQGDSSRLQVYEPLRKYRFTYRLTENDDGIFEIPQQLDMIPKIPRKRLDKNYMRPNGPIIEDTSWTLGEIQTDIQTKLNITKTARSYNIPIDFKVNGVRNLYLPDATLPLVMARTDFNNKIGLGGSTLANVAATHRLKWISDIECFSLDMSRPNSRYLGNVNFKIVDFALRDYFSAVTIVSSNFTVDDIPIRNDGLSMRFAIRHVEDDYYLNKYQLQGTIIEMTLTGGRL